MNKKRIVIVDDHAFVRIGVRALLESQRELEYGFDVVAEAVDGVTGWEAIQQRRPDLVLLDINLPCLDGYELMKRISRMTAPPKVVMLSSFLGNLPVQRAISAGANGFVYKSQDPREMLRAIAAVLAGYCSVPRESVPALSRGAKQGIGALSARERSVAERLIAGRTNKAIAHALCLSSKTISAHKRNIFRKLAIGNLIELADCLRHADSYGVEEPRAAPPLTASTKD